MDWSTLIPTLMGGAISAATAATMFGITQAVERKKRERQTTRELAMNAYVGLQKLMRTANSVLSMKKHIDREFQAAKETGKLETDPALLIRPIIGARAVIDRVLPTESAFLEGKVGGDLLSDIWEIQGRAENNEATVEQFNRLKFEYDAFIQDRLDAVEIIDSSVVSISLEGNDAKAATMRIGALNSLVGALVSNLEEDAAQIKDVVGRYMAAAVERFGADFPMNSLEWKE